MLMYKTPGTKLNRKKTIRAFNGFPAGTDLNGVTDRISGNRKWTVTVLKDAATLFGLEKGGDRETLIGRLVKYLNKPVTLKEVGSTAGASSKKKSRGNPAAKAKKGSDGVKRTLSSYMVRKLRGEREKGRMFGGSGEGERAKVALTIHM